MRGVLRVLRAILWSLFGVRRRDDAARDLESTHPAILIAAALVLVALLVLGMILLVHFVVGRPM